MRNRNYNVKVERHESPQEIASRLRREEADAEHQRKKELLILWAVLMIVGAMTFVCVVIVFLPGTSPENSKWATMFLTTIGSAGIGYMTGKNSK
jgi:hypothetical protein